MPALLAFRREARSAAANTAPYPPSLRRHDDDRRDHEHVDHVSLTKAIIAGARRPLVYVYSARMTNATTSAISAPLRSQSAETHRLEHYLHADQLQRDVGQGREYAGQRYRKREPAVGVAPLDKSARVSQS